MAKHKLSDTKIRRLKIKEKEYTLSDGDGLYITIKPNGTKLWTFIYKSPTLLKRRKTSLGTYPNVSLKTARQKAERLNDLIAQGIDPIDDKREQKLKAKLKELSLFENVVNEWLETQRERIVESTFEKKSNLFKNFVIPRFKNRTIDTIQLQEIVKLLEDKAKSAPETANRLYNYLDNLFRYATMKGYAKNNIIANIHKPTILKPHQTQSYPKITDIKILKELIQAIYNDTKHHYSTINALKFVLHIPLRANNLINLKWEYIDFNKRTLTIPRGLMKNKNPNLPDYKIPLSDEVISILKEQRELTGDTKYIFIGEDGKPISKETPNKALQRLGFNDENKGRKQTLHSFRGTFRSLAETYEPIHKIPEKIQEIVLDHYDKNSVVLAYKHRADYSQQLRKLMEWWSEFIVNLKDNTI